MGKTKKEIYMYYYFAKRVNFYYSNYLNDMLSLNKCSSSLYIKLNNSLINKINFSIYDKISCGFTKNLFNLKNSIIEGKLEDIDCFKLFEAQILESQYYSDYILSMQSVNSNKSSNKQKSLPKKYSEEVRKIFINELRNELLSNSITKILFAFSDSLIWKNYQTENLNKLENQINDYKQNCNNNNKLNYDFFQETRLYNNNSDNKLFKISKNDNFKEEVRLLDETNRFLNNYYQIYAKTNFILKNRELFLYLNAFIAHLINLETLKSPSTKEIKDFTILHYFNVFISPHLYFQDRESSAKSIELDTDIDKNKLI